jgi:cell division protein FtsW (lipid II flippase)
MIHEHEEELNQQRNKVIRRVAETFIIGLVIVIVGWFIQDQKLVYIAGYLGIAGILLLVVLVRGLSAAIYWNRMEKLVWEEAYNE